nr:GHKL domain-containing protein [Bacteroidota bacterium]
NIGLISIDDEKRILFFNPAARRLLKYAEKTPPLYFDKSFPFLYNSIKDQKPFAKKLVKLSAGKDVLHLSVSNNPVKIINQQTHLISLQNIRPELDERELQTWQKMIRVLTHEIMNSISPISSTIQTINEFLTSDNNNTPKAPEEVTKETIKDVVKGLQIIKGRSTGLIGFVGKFRSLTLLPKPKMETLLLADLFSGVEMLFRKEFSDKNIAFSASSEPTKISLIADPNLLQQMLINLIKNAMDALSETSHPSIQFNAFLQDENVVIEISDNGQGIPEDQLDDIFIPFFSTKEQGSGIGLSLSKQIMIQHGGTINIKSDVGQGTVVELRFLK